MTDLEITRLCKEAIGWSDIGPEWSSAGQNMNYNPLHDDAQAMALEDWLIERGRLVFYTDRMIFNPHGYEITQQQTFELTGKSSRRRAICECVAKLCVAKK